MNCQRFSRNVSRRKLSREYMATLKQKEMGRGMAAWAKSRRSKTRPLESRQSVTEAWLEIRHAAAGAGRDGGHRHRKQDIGGFQLENL